MLLLFAVDGLFSFAEGNLFFYNNLFRQRPKALPLESASFKKLDQTLDGKSFRLLVYVGKFPFQNYSPTPSPV